MLVGLSVLIHAPYTYSKHFIPTLSRIPLIERLRRF
jgi:hypothetical protein